METITREDAHALGQKKYYSGQPCKKGHIAERYVSTNGCVACLNGFKQLPPGPSSELRPFVPAIMYVPHDMLPQLQDALNDHLTQAVMEWVTNMGMMTPSRLTAYAILEKGTVEKRKIRDVQMANRVPVVRTTASPPMVPVAPKVPAAPAVPERPTGVASIRR